jgi:hypothetical protein
MIWWILLCLSGTFLTLLPAGYFLKKITSCKLTRSSTLQFPDSYVFNHRIIIASFVEKVSHTGQAIRNVRGFNESFQIE